MSTTASSTYDILVYDSNTFPQTHPDLLGTIAWLFGIETAMADHCRVLELGSGTGANLIPLAMGLPESQFLGIDFSQRQVEISQARVQELGLQNIEFRQASISEVDESYGTFDYIICHGVYSWVSDEIQRAILNICSRHLKENGVAYISYNTLPGWHMRGMIREMMCYHDQFHQQRSPQDRVAQARALVHFLKSASREDTPYGLLLKQELEYMQQSSDSYLFHEHLEHHNEPIYFHEFNTRLKQHNLRYLGEAQFQAMVHHQLPAEVGNHLRQMVPGLIEMQQYLDFLYNRTFRQSLVCHPHHQPKYGVEPRRVYPLYVYGPLRPEGGRIDLTPGVSQNFVFPKGVAIATADSLVKAALTCLAEVTPEALAFEDLRKRARERVGGADPNDPQQVERDREHLGGNLLHLYTAAGVAFIEFWRSYPRFTTEVSERPVASPLARLMVQQGPQVTNLRHQTTQITAFDRRLMHLLDGTQDLGSLISHFAEQFRQGTMNLAHSGQPVHDELQARQVLNAQIQGQLQKYAKGAFLVG